jgi:hypothetical protein
MTRCPIVLRRRSLSRRSTVPCVSVCRDGEPQSAGLPQCRRHSHRPPRQGGQHLFRKRADRDHGSCGTKVGIRAFQTVRLRPDLMSAISTGAVVPRLVHWPVESGSDAAGVMSGSGSRRTASVEELGSGILDPQSMGSREASVAPRRLRTARPWLPQRTAGIVDSIESQESPVAEHRTSGYRAAWTS